MQVSEIQARILAVEFDAFARVGVAQTAKNKTPVISFIVLPMVREEHGDEVSEVSLFNIAYANGAITKFEFEIIEGLFLVDENKAVSNVEGRIAAICNKYNMSSDNLRRRIRPRIVEKVAYYFAKNYNWIMSKNKKNYDYPVNVSDFIDNNVDRLCRSYRYSVQIAREESTYDVLTDYRRIRVLPDTPEFHVYICRTYESMQTAVKDDAIIGLELAELNADDWERYVDAFDCSLTIMDDFITCDEVKKDRDFLIFKFARPDSSRTLDSANVICHYKVGGHVTRFPVKLINHFTTGGVNVDFSIKGSGIGNIEYADYFAGFDGASPLLERSVSVKRFPPSTGMNGVSITIPANALIFPGSGVEFFWNTAEAHS